MLKEIIENKKKEVRISKEKSPLSEFVGDLGNSERNFHKSIRKKTGFSQKSRFFYPNLIAEIKRKSPSYGVLNKRADFGEIIGIYDMYASAISVLTDKKFFAGSLQDLGVAGKLTKLPLLRKDFIVDEYQIYESRLHNADAILLIASILKKSQIKNYIEIAKSYQMASIVEVHTEEELEKALSVNAEIIGINNRNLDTLKISPDTTLSLADKVPKNKVIVSESGIESGDYMKKISGKVDAVLIGSFFMKSANLEDSIKSLGMGKNSTP